MKKHLTTIIIALIGVLFCSCTKSDMREHFVGNYKLNVQGTLTMNNPYGVKRTIVVNATDLNMEIEKNPGVQNGVCIKGYYHCNATVDKSSIYLEQITLIDTLDEIPMTLNIAPTKGVLDANGILTFEAPITGTAYYQQLNADIEGTFHNSAVKQ